MVRVVGIDYGFEHRVGAGNAAAILPNDKQAYRCDPLVVAEERLPPLIWGLLRLAIKQRIQLFWRARRTGPRTPGRRLNLLTARRGFWSSSVTQRTDSARRVVVRP